jgi:hypothetical protein
MRRYHSPSSVDVRCDRAWAYRYIHKIRPAEIAWPDIESGAVPLMKYGALPQPGECTFSQRSFALGKAFHDVAARFYTTQPPVLPSTSLPVQMFQEARHLLPPYGTPVWVERGVGDTFPPEGAELEPHDARVWYEFKGIKMVGSLDLFDVGACRLYDYKTCADITQYAKSAEDLQSNTAAAVYAYHCMQVTGTDLLACAWLYTDRKVRRSKLVEFEMSLTRAENVIARAIGRAKHQDAIADAESAEPRLDLCEEMGGCEYHCSRGGPCSARKRVKVEEKKSHMAMSPELMKQLDLLRKQDIDSAAPAEETAPAEESAPPKRSRGRPRKSEAPVVQLDLPIVAAPAATQGAVQSGAVIALATSYDDALMRRAQIEAEIEDLRAQIRAAIEH